MWRSKPQPPSRLQRSLSNAWSALRMESTFERVQQASRTRPPKRGQKHRQIIQIDRAIMHDVRRQPVVRRSAVCPEALQHQRQIVEIDIEIAVDVALARRLRRKVQ